MTFTRYQCVVRAECISLMGCTKADESLDRMGDECFRANAGFHYRRKHPAATAAHAWIRGVNTRRNVT